MRKKREELPKPGVPEYMLTYGDMMTLLLCFFVLLFAFSTINAQKFQEAAISLSGSLGVLEGGNTLQKESVIEKGLTQNNAQSSRLDIDAFNELEKRLDAYVEKNNLGKNVTVKNEEAGIMLRFQDEVIFDPGQAVLKDSVLNILNYVGDILNEPDFKDKYVNIEGHTDDVPVSGRSIYKDNWDLSVARASHVVRFLIYQKNISPLRLSASGYSQYHPLVKNDTRENRTKNRRVDILIIRDRQDKSLLPRIK